jgi:hypothetical protein
MSWVSSQVECKVGQLEVAGSGVGGVPGPLAGRGVESLPNGTLEGDGVRRGYPVGGWNGLPLPPPCFHVGGPLSCVSDY